MKDYMLAYLQMVVLQLADIFQTCCVMCKKDYRLDPIHYPTAPGLLWKVAFKYTKPEVDLLSDVQMMRDFESGICRGMTFVNKQWCAKKCGGGKLPGNVWLRPSKATVSPHSCRCTCMVANSAKNYQWELFALFLQSNWQRSTGEALTHRLRWGTT